MFWKIFEGGNRIPDWYILRKWHDRKTLKKIINDFEKKTRSTNKNNNNKNNSNKKQTIVFPWIPKIVPKIKKEIQKIGFRVAFQAGPNLKNILCKNKDKLIPNSYPGVYALKCSFESVYNGETKKKIISRSIEHQQESTKVTGHPLELPNTQRNPTDIF